MLTDHLRRLAVVLSIATALAAPAAAQEADLGAIQKALVEFLGKHKPGDWDASLPDESTTAEALKNSLREYDRDTKATSYIHHAVALLVRHKPDDDFARVLWRLATFVEVEERGGDTVLDQAFLPFLLEQLATLPKTNDFYVEGQFLAAASQARAKQFQNEEKTLKAILDLASIGDSFKITALQRLAANYEQQKRWPEAIDILDKTQPFLDKFPSASDSLLRSIVIALEIGRVDDALRRIEALRGVDEFARNAAEYAKPIGEMLALAKDPAKARAYWEGSARWWPAWKKLWKELDLDPLVENRIAIITNQAGLRGRFTREMKENGAPGFFNAHDYLLHGLRWFPGLLNNAGTTTCFDAPRLKPEKIGLLQRFMIVLADNYTWDDPEQLRYLRLYHSMCLHDTGQSKEALKVIDAFFAANDKDDRLAQGMTRLWAMSAVKADGDLEGPAMALEKVLEGDAVNRHQTVLALAEVYRKQKKLIEEETLLTEELKRLEPNAENEEAMRLLAARLQNLRTDGLAGIGLGKGIAGWAKTNVPEWLLNAPPADLSDPRLKDLRGVLDNPGTRFTPEELVRVRFLAAQSDDLPFPSRELAFRQVLIELLAATRTHKEARKLIAGVLDNRDFPDATRTFTILLALDDAVATGNRKGLGYYMAHPAIDRRNARIADALRVYGRFAQTDLESAESLRECYQHFSEGSIDQIELGMISQLFERLLTMGNLDIAGDIYGKIVDWNLEPGVSQTPATLRLMFLKSLKQSRAALPLSDAMFGVAKAFDDFSDAEEPEIYETLRDPFDFEKLSMKDAHAIMRWQLKRGLYPRIDARYWIDFVESLGHGDPKVTELAFKLLENLLEKQEDDTSRSMSIFSAPSLIDTDEPVLRERLLKLLAKWRDPEKNPHTYAAIRVLEIDMQVRLGEQLDLIGVLANLEHPLLGSIGKRLRHRQYFNWGKKGMLRTALQAMPPDELLDPEGLGQIIPALDFARLKEESELARETALEKLPALIAAAARHGDLSGATAVADIATAIGKKDMVPPNFFRKLAERTAHERTRPSLLILQHDFDENWEALDKEASAAVASFPTFYHYYWWQGKARWMLDRKDDARKPLEVYSNYCRDENNHNQALEWLKSLGDAAPEPK